MIAVHPRKRHGWRLFLQTVVARAYPRIVGQHRETLWAVLEVLLPVLSVATYVFIYRALHAPDAFTGFVVVGGAMTPFWMNVLWSMASQLYWEKEQGNLALFIIAPGPLMAMLLGMAVGGMLSSAVRAAVLIVMGVLLFHVQFFVTDPGALVLVFLLTMTALYGLGMMGASLFLLLGREAWHFSNLVQEPIHFLSGFYFPVRSLGYPVALAASIIPLTLGLDGMRQLLFPAGKAAGLLPLGTELLLLALSSAVFIVAAWLLLTFMERLAIREGRITESRA